MIWGQTALGVREARWVEQEGRLFSSRRPNLITGPSVYRQCMGEWVKLRLWDQTDLVLDLGKSLDYCDPQFAQLQIG